MFVITVRDKMLIKHLTVNSVQYKESTGRGLVPFSPLCVKHQQVYAIVLEKGTKRSIQIKKQTLNPGRRVPQRKKSICRTRMQPENGRMYKSISNWSFSSGEKNLQINNHE